MKTATQEDLQLFANWLAGNGMPTVDTYGWLIRCEEWVNSHTKGELDASQGSNS
jgi:hypothetical protein